MYWLPCNLSFRLKVNLGSDLELWCLGSEEMIDTVKQLHGFLLSKVEHAASCRTTGSWLLKEPRLETSVLVLYGPEAGFPGNNQTFSVFYPRINSTLPRRCFFSGRIKNELNIPQTLEQECIAKRHCSYRKLKNRVQVSPGTKSHYPVALLFYNCHPQRHKFGSPARCGFGSSLLSPTAPEDGVILFLALAGNSQSCVGTIKLDRCLVERG